MQAINFVLEVHSYLFVFNLAKFAIFLALFGSFAGIGFHQVYGMKLNKELLSMVLENRIMCNSF